MATAPRPPPPQSRASRASVSRAVESLLKWIRAQRNPENIAATVHDDFVYLILTLAKTPQQLQCKSYSIPLPHPLHDASTVSLILDDRPNSLINLSAARDLVHSFSLPISQILCLSDLRSGILPCGNLLFADRRIAKLVQSFEKEGKNKKSKRSKPVEVDFMRKAWPEYVRRACFSTVLNLGSGTCRGIRVGRASQGIDNIVDNVLAAIDGAVQIVPRKWSNVLCFHLKTSESLALPIYKKSDWTQKKVGGDVDDENSEEEERIEHEELIKKEKKAEGATRKRVRDVSELDGGMVRKNRKNNLRYDIDK